MFIGKKKTIKEPYFELTYHSFNLLMREFFRPGEVDQFGATDFEGTLSKRS